MVKERFSGSFTQQEAIPETAIDTAVAVMRSGRLHRYNLAEGEIGETACLESEYASWQGRKYCLALASAGQAMQIAMRAAGIQSGDKVLTNGFTLAPVPGAIHALGAKPVLVDITEDLRIDLDDLAVMATASGAKFLLLSHMRGHLCDMDQLMDVADRANLSVIEDCAHTMGARWNGVLSGNFGLAACFSTQTYKHLNSGEGGLLVSDDPDLMARATILSGSYMHFDRHGAGPDHGFFAQPRLDMPNLSARMDHLRAALLRPQIALLEDKVDRWNMRYTAVAGMLKRSNRIVLPNRPAAEHMVGSSIQFRIPAFDQTGCETLLDKTGARGVELKWFGAPEPAGFTSTHDSWRYIAAQELPRTDATLATLFDMRLPLTFSQGDCETIGRIIRDVVDEVLA
jgi:dTDP-4-amino-4,6-dideoxygalactose transaminase